MIPFQGKAQSLGFLKGLGLKVPDWRVIAHEQILSWGSADLQAKLHLALTSRNKELSLICAQNFVESILIPEIDLLEKIHPLWSIRSSADLEDSPEHSFAGIFHTELNVRNDLTTSIKNVWSSLYAPRALSYCEQRGISWEKLRMNVILQEMISGDVSGVLFQGEKILISAGKGSASDIVSGKLNSDLYILNHDQIERFVCAGQGPVLKSRHFDSLMAASTLIRRNSKAPLDIEFSFKGSELYLLQARPITSPPELLPESMDTQAGIICSPGEVTAECRVNPKPSEELQGKILIIHNGESLQDYIHCHIAGVVVEEGSLLSHAGILARELGIPCLMKVGDITKRIQDGDVITLNANLGLIQVR